MCACMQACLLIPYMHVSVHPFVYDLEIDVWRVFIGGLGDVAGSLPKALARRGHRVMVMLFFF